MSHEILEITTVHPTGGTYSHAVRTGGTLYIAGQVAKDRDATSSGSATRRRSAGRSSRT
jgi:enamine deaminase RidA (YjgF/YER057c/UK114 family)